MANKRWLRPAVAFMLTFGVLAMAASLVRVVVVYRHLIGLGMATDDPSVADRASQELSRMDQLYTPTFLIVATLVSVASATFFAWWRPGAKADLPPPLPGRP